MVKFLEWLEEVNVSHVVIHRDDWYQLVSRLHPSMQLEGKPGELRVNGTCIQYRHHSVYDVSPRPMGLVDISESPSPRFNVPMNAA